jgi:DNA-binding LytR/AlgR family response regulator
MKKNPTALIAEDEPLLAAALQAELEKAWPALQVVAVMGNGQAAVAQALILKPDVVFLDIRMPGLTGLEAAAELADEWPVDEADAPPFPALVFVTAYDEYALQAFEAQAMGYVLKPVQTERLARTAQRLKAISA